MKYHDFFVENVLPTDSVLDLGCGDGSLTRDVAGKAHQVIGIDIKEANIEKAKANCQKENAKFIVGDATTYAFDDKFDKIILSNVLEHIDHRIEFLKSLHKLSDTILLRVPMLDRDWLVVYKKQKGLEYRLDKTHFIEYTLESLNQELSSAGWQLKNHTRQFGELWGVVEKAK
jgi:SAM-dependent methyltransferase